MWLCFDGTLLKVVDMRWGIREDAASDHSTVDIVLKEIENCQAVSAGTNFVVICLFSFYPFFSKNSVRSLFLCLEYFHTGFLELFIVWILVMCISCSIKII